jgi:hypothetical protein
VISDKVRLEGERITGLIAQRLKNDGFPWYGDDETDVSLNKSEKGVAVKLATQSLGVALVYRGGTDRVGMERLVFLANLFKQQGTGELTETVRSLFTERFPGTRANGPAIRRARELAGVEAPDAEHGNGKHEDAVVMSPPLREALNMIGHVERLQKTVNGIEVKIEELEREKARLKVEIDLYKPAMSHLRALEQAVNGIKNKVGELK